MTLPEFASLVAEMRRLQVEVRRMGSGKHAHAEVSFRDLRSRLEKVERDVDDAIAEMRNGAG